MLQEQAPFLHRLQQRKFPAWARNGEDEAGEPSTGADIDKPHPTQIAAVRALERGQHGEGVGHVARHDLALVGDGGEVHPLVPVEEGVHVEGNLALLRRREAGGGGGGGGWGGGGVGPRVVEDCVADLVVAVAVAAAA